MSNKLFKSSFSYTILQSFVGQSSYTLLSIFLTFIIARFFGPEILGRYSYITTFLLFLSVFIKAGMDNSIMFFIPQKGPNYISFCFFIAFILFVIIGGASFLIIMDQDLSNFLFLSFILASQDIFFGIYKANGQIKEYFLLKTTIVICLQIVLVVIGYNLLLRSLFFLLLVFAIPNTLLVLILVIKNSSKFQEIIFGKDFIKYSIPMMFTAMLGLLMNRIDILMLGNMVNMTELGVYRVVVQISSFSALILGIFNIAFAPKIAKLYSQNKITELVEIYSKSTRVLCILGSCVLLVIFFFNKSLLQIFGDEYIYATKTLLLVSLGQFFVISVGSVGFMLTMIAKPHLQLYRIIMAASSNIILNYFLINKYGINGAATASMIALFISSFVGYLFLKRVLQIKVFKFF